MRTGEKNEAREDTYLHNVGEAIKAAMPTLDKTDQQIATAVYRLMSRGEPVETEDGIQGAPTEAELRRLLLSKRPT